MYAKYIRLFTILFLIFTFTCKLRDLISPEINITSPEDGKEYPKYVELKVQIREENLNSVSVFDNGKKIREYGANNILDTLELAYGVHELTVRAVDLEGNVGKKSVKITTRNFPPKCNKPEIESYDSVRREVKLRVTAIDPDRDSVAVQFDFGDGTQSQWSSYIASGTSVSVSKRWSAEGVYYVKARGRDRYGALSSWSDSLRVEIINRSPSVTKPSGPTSGRINTEYTYSVVVSDPDGDSVAVQFDFGDGTQSQWSSYIASGTSVSVSKRWSAEGVYYVKARGRDRYGALSSWSDSLRVEIINRSPSVTKPSGPTSGRINTEYTYSVVVSDPDGDSVAVQFDFGDGTQSQWSGYVASGTSVSVSKRWSAEGVYYVKARGRDRYGALSSWSDSLRVEIINRSPSVTKPTGYTMGGINMSYTYSVVVSDPDGDSVAVQFDFGDGTQSQWSGYVASGTSVSVSKRWSAEGVYYVKARGRDRYGALSSWSDSLRVEILNYWQRTYGGSDYDYAYSICPASGGGYVVAGYTRSYWGGYPDVYLLKIDEGGNKVWERTYGGSHYDEAYSICPASGGGYVVAGYTSSYEADYYDVYLLKIDESGNKVWERTYGGGNWDCAYSICPASGGGYVVAGYTWSYEAGGVYLLKIDENGNKVWERTYGGSDYDKAYSICPASGGGYVVAGYTGSYVTGHDVYLLKIDENGNKVWERTYGGSNYDGANSISPAPGGGYVVAGYTYSYGAGESDVYLLKIDESGNKVWERTYGGSNYDEAYSICPASGGGYVVAGFTWSYGAGYYDVYLLKIDESGNKVWERTYGGGNWDYAYSICPASGGGYVVAGYTLSYGSGEADVYLIKIDENGYAPPIEGKADVSRRGNILDDIYPKNLRTPDHNFIIPRSRLKDR
ncbi:MAG: hypothetical protein ABIM31_05520 [candidate division WOR-3 bacterium]